MAGTMSAAYGRYGASSEKPALPWRDDLALPSSDETFPAGGPAKQIKEPSLLELAAELKDLIRESRLRRSTRGRKL